MLLLVNNSNNNNNNYNNNNNTDDNNDNNDSIDNNGNDGLSLFQFFVLPAVYAMCLLHQNSQMLSATHRLIALVYGVAFILIFLISTLFHAVSLTGKAR